MAHKIEERVGIRASQARVWEVLSDFEGWKDWNPLYPKVDGRLGIGAPLTLEQRLPGQPPETISVGVIDWIPYEQIHWGTQLARGWAQYVQYIEIEPLGAENCIFSIGRLYGGFLGDYIAKRARRTVRAGFEQMCEALRVEAEKAPAKDVLAAPPPPDPAAKAPDDDVSPPSAGGRKKPSALKPPKLNQYAPKAFGMKPPGFPGAKKP
jgi:hypothetical protein